MGRMLEQMQHLCPCHSQKKYAECCQPFHQGKLPPTPEALMRSRYSAYAMGLVDYILQTQNAGSAEEIEQFCKATIFKELKILEAKENTVTFTAYLEQNGRDCSFTEKSTFEKVHGKWIYVKGEML
jgi:uncharacterized protein YchJ